MRRIGVVLAGGGAHLPAVQAMVMHKRWLGFGIKLTLLPSTPLWVQELETAQELDPLFSQLSAAFGAALSTREAEEPHEIRSVSDSSTVMTL